MPIDDFQKKVIKAIMPLRSPGSTFAGGSVLQRHGFRRSDDQDLFHSDDADIASIAGKDIDALKSAGFDVKVLRPLEGLFEALVSREAHTSAVACLLGGARKGRVPVSTVVG